MFLTDLTNSELLVLIGTIFILFYLICEVFGLCTIFLQIFEDIHDYFFGYKIVYGYSQQYGPYTWKNSFSASKGKQQSPINIISRNSMVIPVSTNSNLEFIKGLTPKMCMIKNTGLGVTICCLFHEEQPAATLSGGPLSGVYRFVYANFRWGANELEGSEHTIDNKRYAMELQVVYFKDDTSLNASFEEASAKKAIVIVSYLYKISSEENSFLEAFICHLPEICEPGCQYQFCGFPLDWLIVPFNKNYYMYKGSLTQPPCVEGVTWLVQAEPLTLSWRQLDRFRQLRSIEGGKLIHNTRPVQRAKGRSVYYYD